jgi:hypothetical protein
MGQWIQADGGERCPHCGEIQEEGWDMMQQGDELVCEPCVEDAVYYPDDLYDFDDDLFMIDGVGFADPGGRSSLRAETEDNPRNMPCPDCGTDNVLTPLDVAAGYCCNQCADQNEGGF